MQGYQDRMIITAADYTLLYSDPDVNRPLVIYLAGQDGKNRPFSFFL
jgi:hypothetical protein